MKTAIQQLIDKIVDSIENELQVLKNYPDYDHRDVEEARKVYNSTIVLVELAESFLDAEKAQIQDAFDVGQANWDKKCRDISDGNEYYKSAFTNK